MAKSTWLLIISILKCVRDTILQKICIFICHWCLCCAVSQMIPFQFFSGGRWNDTWILTLIILQTVRLFHQCFVLMKNGLWPLRSNAGQSAGLLCWMKWHLSRILHVLIDGWYMNVPHLWLLTYLKWLTLFFIVNLQCA